MLPVARVIAFYLPQFHPIPENDEWWGKGFTEWTNVAKARPLFRGHYQPNVPGDLGFYDLRLPEVRLAQAELARAHGVEGFCYWHYWFAGRRILERPFNEVLKSGEPDFPFCLGWANQSWTGIWHGAPKRVLLEQTYPGPKDHERHFYAVLEAFQDPRYIRVRNKPVFLIYRPNELPEQATFIDQWQKLAEKNGLPGVHFVAYVMNNDRFDYLSNGFSAAMHVNTFSATSQTAWSRALRWHRARSGTASDSIGVWAKSLFTAAGIKARKHLLSSPRVPGTLRYEEAMLYLLDHVAADTPTYPCVVPNWDNTPRSGARAMVLLNATPELFREHLRAAVRLIESRPREDRIIFLKSWNEWAEGNYVEPDLRYGRQLLDVIRETVMTNASHVEAPAPVAV
jgi:hypothetical protein